MNLSMLYDFMQVIYSTREHHAKNEEFSMHMLFTTIYLIQEQKLNPNKYSEQEINMSKVVQSTEHDVHMYAKIHYENTHRFL
jgi:hypothetical protein